MFHFPIHDHCLCLHSQMLAINDSRSIGRFFLLLSMYSSQELRPDNLIRSHCTTTSNGICESYDYLSKKSHGDPFLKPFQFSSDHQSKTVVLFRDDKKIPEPDEGEPSSNSVFKTRVEGTSQINLTLSYRNLMRRVKYSGRAQNCGDQKLLTSNEIPKYLLMSLQQELVAAWPCLLSALPKCVHSSGSSKVANCNDNKESSLTLRKKEMKLHIDLKPFELMEKNLGLAATQQILFDNPWLSMFELHNQVSGERKTKVSTVFLMLLLIHISYITEFSGIYNFHVMSHKHGSALLFTQCEGKW